MYIWILIILLIIKVKNKKIRNIKELVFDSQEEAILADAKIKYGDIALEFVIIYKTKPTLGVAIEGGINTRQPEPTVISIQVVDLSSSSAFSKTIIVHHLFYGSYGILGLCAWKNVPYQIFIWFPTCKKIVFYTGHINH